jgi:hypothetical protein
LLNHRPESPRPCIFGCAHLRSQTEFAKDGNLFFPFGNEAPVDQPHKSCATLLAQSAELGPNLALERESGEHSWNIESCLSCAGFAGVQLPRALENQTVAPVLNGTVGSLFKWHGRTQFPTLLASDFEETR